MLQRRVPSTPGAAQHETKRFQRPRRYLDVAAAPAEPNGEIPDNNPIDEALADVRAYNAKNPQKPLAVGARSSRESKRPHGQ